MATLIEVTDTYLRVNDGDTFDTDARYVETTTGTPDFVTIEGISCDEAFDGTSSYIAWVWKIGSATYECKNVDGSDLAGTPALTFNTTTNIKLTD